MDTSSIVELAVVDPYVFLGYHGLYNRVPVCGDSLSRRPQSHPYREHHMPPAVFSVPRRTLCLILGLLSLWIAHACALSLVEASETRAIRVQARTPDGSAKEFQLYSGYYALVVGAGAYQSGWPRLPNPVKDAEEVSKALSKLGFQVELVKDPDSKTLRRALNRLVAQVGQDREKGILFYFAGHGHTLTRADQKKLGYIVPVDAPDPESNLLEFMERAISMQELEQLSVLIASKHVMMVFDSCFSGAIFALSRAKPPKHIEEQVTKPVRLFISAGSESEQVPDQSVFKVNFLQGLMEGYADLNKDGYVTGQELGSYLQERVVNYSDGAQNPQFGKIRNPELDKGDFVFALGKTAAPAPAPPVTTAKSPDSPGSLSITSKPEGAAVYVDGLREGTTPVTIADLSAGPATVRVAVKGYSEEEERVRIRSGRETRIHFDLKALKQVGAIAIQSEPPNAGWYLDDVYVGTTPDEAADVKPGKRKVTVKLEGYDDWSRTLDVKADERTTMHALLSPRTSRDGVPEGRIGSPETGRRDISREDRMGTPETGRREVQRGTRSYQDPSGTVSVPVPENWILPDPNVFQQFQSLAPWYVFNAVDPSTRSAVDVYLFGSHDPQQCLSMLLGLSYSLGIAFSYGQGRPFTVSQRSAYLFPVSFTNNLGANEGELVLVQTGRGYVGLLFSSPMGYYRSVRPLFEQMLGQTRFSR